jgi:hypothetical protein
VQEDVAEEKLCERGIATARRCATIGTVQGISKEISGTLHYGFLPNDCPQDLIARGKPAAQGFRLSHMRRKAFCVAPQEIAIA